MNAYEFFCNSAQEAIDAAVADLGDDALPQTIDELLNTIDAFDQGQFDEDTTEAKNKAAVDLAEEYGLAQGAVRV